MTGPYDEKRSAGGCNLLPSYDHGSLVSPSDQSTCYIGTPELASACDDCILLFAHCAPGWDECKVHTLRFCENGGHSGGEPPVHIDERCHSHPKGGAE